MITRKLHIPFLLPLLAVSWVVSTLASAEITTDISTHFLAQGEQGIFEIRISGGDPDVPPVVPKIPQVGFRAMGSGRIPGRNRRNLEYVFQYGITSYTNGTYTIPPIEISVSGEKQQSKPIEFQVFDPNTLPWADAEVNGHSFHYAAAFMSLRDHPYLGETMISEIKLYVPSDLASVVQDWGVPEFKRDGVAAWRYQLSEMPSQISLRGVEYRGRTYPSTMTATRTGRVEIGPATVRLTTVQLMMDPFARRSYEPVTLDIPTLALDVVPLPEGAPDGFRNAIGDFSIAATTTQTELHEGEPLSVELTVTGSGNLDTLQAPELQDSDGWKVYDAVSNQRGDERRELNGTVTYQQMLRPLELKPSIPPFRLVYFNPSTAEYQTVTTQPIPLKILPSTNPGGTLAGPPQALPMPVEQMSDILGLIKPAQLTMPGGLSLPGWSLHLIGALLTLGLIVKASWHKVASKLQTHPDTEAKKKELQQLDRMKDTDSFGFLKAAGSFVERWLGNVQEPEIQQILAERDQICFRAEKPTDAELSSSRKSEIVKQLRKFALAIALLFLVGATVQPANAAESVSDKAAQAYNSADYQEAIKLWLGAGDYKSLSADVLYDIGNACYRLGSPGNAALYYRRALNRDATHPEAQQNLRFIERKYGAITVHHQQFQYQLSKVSLNTWKGTFWLGIWLCILAILVFPATQPTSKLRMAAIPAFVIAPLLFLIGAVGWKYYPDEAKFAPIAEQAVVVDKDVVAHTDAARTSPTVIHAPPGSLCRILHQSGRWSYVSFATQTRGWVITSSLEKVQSDKTPEPPKINISAPDGSNA
ncbi:BatD family protein [Luteolibacter pohnpeiensis]|uniref:BatD family protein n=1 Tax=Luteolibacter pohnpeiensis TaxID=454153 RepID=A0A934SDI0_9BACT|nr:BatD family protein [Luteolibacter pohnpeiensis]MBK1883233.1 BatD family protein [Luteolibacter pohnpeiensis]